jgi:uncharacterized OB-fold protein
MSVLIAEGLFRIEGDRAVLLGSRRRATGHVKFPAERPELTEGYEDLEMLELSTEGRLFTFTTQEFPPPHPYKGDRSPEGFRPYVVGYVELLDGVLVESLIVGAGAEDLRIGQRLVSTTTTLQFTDGEVVTFAFTPA